jgi:Peptidase family M1 domain
MYVEAHRRDIRAMRALPPSALFAALVLAMSCASWPRHQQPDVAPTAAAPESSRTRPYPVFETNAFARAVERGTRTRTGVPGPNYWQQFARYRIDAELVPTTSQINGRETVRYFNNSPDTLKTVWMFLNQNLFAATSPRGQSVPVTGGTEILRFAVAGQALARRDTGVAYSVDGTLMRVGLPRALAPHDSVEFDIAWAFQLPPDGAPREGTTGDVVMVAYWYPQFAVYDDVTGWQIDPYLGGAEFYMDYADYDVNLSVPQGWLVAATGELMNPTEVLSRQTRDRLAEAHRGPSVVHVVRETDRGAGNNRATNTGFDGILKWRFRARNVRDFDWGASAKFLWDATVAVVGDRDRDGHPDSTDINTYYRPEARAWSWGRSAEFERNSVEFLSNYLWPYPWPRMSALEGPVSCTGMEYPMLTCIGGPRDTLSLFSVQVHETGHMWFPMQVGSDERRYAWQDEGLTRFNQAQGMQWYFKGYDRERISRNAYLALAGTDSEVALMRHGDQYPFGTPAYSVASYDKMATNMVALRALLGDETFLSSYRTYGLRWLQKHPTQYDFFNTFSALAGRDLSWFWRTWWYETWTLDQAIGSVSRSTAGDTLRVTIEDRGLAMMPVRLAVTRADGRVERIVVPVDVWLSGARRQIVTLLDAATITAVEIDPEQVFPDADRSNNRWAKS